MGTAPSTDRKPTTVIRTYFSDGSYNDREIYGDAIDPVAVEFRAADDTLLARIAMDEANGDVIDLDGSQIPEREEQLLSHAGHQALVDAADEALATIEEQQ